MATPHLAATCMSLLSTSSGLPGEPATESHTSVSATMSYNECYNVCSENGTIYCTLQGDRCTCSDTYVRSSVDQRDSAASTRTQMRQSVITGPFQATQRCRIKIYHCGPIACGIDAMPLLNWESGIISTAGRGTAHVISIVGSRPTRPKSMSHEPA